MKDIIEKLKSKNKTIATMESATGGFIVSAITNVEGASEILKFSAVTYNNEYKIKMGVDKALIDKYSVYSKEVAQNMAYNISLFADSDYGVGITGKINRVDKNNMYGEDNMIFVSVYDFKATQRGSFLSSYWSLYLNTLERKCYFKLSSGIAYYT